MGKVNPKCPTFYHKSAIVDNLLIKFITIASNKKILYQ